MRNHQLSTDPYKVEPPSEAEADLTTEDGKKYVEFCVGEFVSAALLEDQTILVFAPHHALLRTDQKVPLDVVAAVADHRYSTAYPDKDFPTNGDIDPELERLGFEFETLWS